MRGLPPGRVSGCLRPRPGLLDPVSALRRLGDLALVLQSPGKSVDLVRAHLDRLGVLAGLVVGVTLDAGEKLSLALAPGGSLDWTSRWPLRRPSAVPGGEASEGVTKRLCFLVELMKTLLDNSSCLLKCFGHGTPIRNLGGSVSY